MMNLETHRAARMLHSAINRQDRGADARELFVAAHLHEQLEELRANSLVLIRVADDDREFGFVRAVKLAQAAETENFALTRLRGRALDDQRHLAVVIDEAESRQSFVSDTLIQPQRRE